MIQYENQELRRYAAFADSADEAYRWVADNRRWTMRSSIKEGRGHSWDLGVGWNGLDELLRDGWKEGVEQMQDGLRTLPQTAKRAGHRYDVAGAEPDIPRYLGNEPMHMRRKSNRITNHQVVNLFLELGASSATKASQFVNYGLALVSLVDQLEKNGRRVELSVAFSSFTSGWNTIQGWRVKQPDQPMDLAAIAFSIAHPAAFRRLGFAMIETSPRTAQSSGYGSSGDGKPKWHLMELGLPMDCIRLNGIGHNPRGHRTPRASLVELVNEINAELGEGTVEVGD